jgi:hypothetical protein
MAPSTAPNPPLAFGQARLDAPTTDAPPRLQGHEHAQEQPKARGRPISINSTHPSRAWIEPDERRGHHGTFVQWRGAPPAFHQEKDAPTPTPLPAASAIGCSVNVRLRPTGFSVHGGPRSVPSRSRWRRPRSRRERWCLFVLLRDIPMAPAASRKGPPPSSRNGRLATVAKANAVDVWPEGKERCVRPVRPRAGGDGLQRRGVHGVTITTWAAS